MEPYLPDGDAARAVAHRARAAAVSLHTSATTTGQDLTGQLDSWDGLARTSFDRLVIPLLSAADDVADALAAYAIQLDSLGDDLDQLHLQQRRIIATQALGDGLLLASVAQLGLDPATDAATVWARGGAAAARALLTDTLRAAIARLGAALTSRTTLRTSLRALGRWAVPQVRTAIATDLLVQEAFTGGIDPHDLATAAALGFIPLPELTARNAVLARLRTALPRGLFLQAHEGIAGAHTIARHVGKDTAYLDSRLAAERKMNLASSFATTEDADRALLAALLARVDHIDAFARGSKRSTEFTAQLGDAVRVTARRRAVGLGFEDIPRAELKTVKVRLKRDGDDQPTIDSVFVEP